MKTIKKRIEIDGIAVELIRKNMKSIRLVVVPPDGQVRISAPRRVSQDYIYAFMHDNLSWIKEQRQKLKNRPAFEVPQYTSGEIHRVWGQEKQLVVFEQSRTTCIESLSGDLHMFVRHNSTTKQREKKLNAYYRQELEKAVPLFVDKHQRNMGVNLNEWRIKNMKTRWGSCNINARRIWLNLALVKYPKECLEYVIVHELAHLLERYHNNRFWSLVETHFPDWKAVRKHLNEN